jgi:hypothetical protein
LGVVQPPEALTLRTRNVAHVHRIGSPPEEGKKAGGRADGSPLNNTHTRKIPDGRSGPQPRPVGPKTNLSTRLINTQDFPGGFQREAPGPAPGGIIQNRWPHTLYILVRVLVTCTYTHTREVLGHGCARGPRFTIGPCASAERRVGLDLGGGGRGGDTFWFLHEDPPAATPQDPCRSAQTREDLSHPSSGPRNFLACLERRVLRVGPCIYHIPYVTQ